MVYSNSCCIVEIFLLVFLARKERYLCLLFGYISVCACMYVFIGIRINHYQWREQKKKKHFRVVIHEVYFLGSLVRKDIFMSVVSIYMGVCVCGS